MLASCGHTVRRPHMISTHTYTDERKFPDLWQCPRPSCEEVPVALELEEQYSAFTFSNSPSIASAFVSNAHSNLWVFSKDLSIIRATASRSAWSCSTFLMLPPDSSVAAAIDLTEVLTSATLHSSKCICRAVNNACLSGLKEITLTSRGAPCMSSVRRDSCLKIDSHVCVARPLHRPLRSRRPRNVAWHATSATDVTLLSASLCA